MPSRSRRFILILTGWLALLLGGCGAPAAPVYHIAIVASGQSRLVKAQSLEQGLRDRGYVPEENLYITIYDAENHGDRLSELTRQAIASDPDILVTLGGIETQIAKKEVSDADLPIVFIGVADTVDWGVVASFRHPGRGITGIDNGYIEITSKRLEYLTLLLPQARRVLVLYSSQITPSRAALAQAQWAAPHLGLSLQAADINDERALQRFADALQPGQADAILITPSFTLENALPATLLPAATRAGIPIVGLNQDVVAAGGLAAYGASFQNMGYQAARLVDKVLHGVPPGDIPVEFPDTPEFTVNRDVVTALDLAIDPETMCLADHILPEMSTGEGP